MKIKKYKSELTTLLILVFITVLLEVSFFNLRHWTTRFISAPSENALTYTTTPGDYLHVTSTQITPLAPGAELVISDINHPIRTVLIRPMFGDSNINRTYFTIRYRDENNITYHRASIINGYSPSFYIPLGAMGNVSSLTVIFNSEHVSVQVIYFNMPLPFVFRWVRVIFLTILTTLVWVWKKHGLSKIPYNPKLAWQTYVNAGVVAGFILLLFFSMIFSVDINFIPGSGNQLHWNPSRQGQHDINARMVEALLLGQLHLDIEPHESLLAATQPYSLLYRNEHWVHAPWDHAFYNGRFFSYFGIVPVVILFLPYYLISGTHISATFATFIFSIIAAVGIYFLWNELLRKYVKELPYTLYLAGLVTALFGSHLTPIMVRAHNYEVALSGGLMFTAWGIYFILRSISDESFETVNAKSLFVGSVCMALAVGSRPTMLLVSLIVPVLLFPFLRSLLCKLRTGKSFSGDIKIILALGIPYMTIGAALAWYNYARFGSITEFGSNYQLTMENISVLTHTGVLGNLRRVSDGIFTFMFNNFSLQPRFPYVTATYSQLIFTGFMSRTATIGAFMLPVTWFLPSVVYLRKKPSGKQALPLVISMVATGMLIAIMATVLIGTISRYSVDFFWLLVLPSLMCMGIAYNEACKLGNETAKIVRHLGFAAMAVTCFIMFTRGVMGEDSLIWRHNPVVIRYLADLFSVL